MLRTGGGPGWATVMIIGGMLIPPAAGAQVSPNGPVECRPCENVWDSQVGDWRHRMYYGGQYYYCEPSGCHESWVWGWTCAERHYFCESLALAAAEQLLVAARADDRERMRRLLNDFSRYLEYDERTNELSVRSCVGERITRFSLTESLDK